MMETVGVVRVAEQVENTTFEFDVGETPESLWPGQWRDESRAILA